MAPVISPAIAIPYDGFLLTLDLSGVRITPEQFEQLCRNNRELRLELTSNGELIVMPPTGSDTGAQNATLNAQLWIWAKSDRTGVAFDSSTGFTLPNGAIRSPDASWINRKVEILEDPEAVRDDLVLPGFELNIRELW